MNKRRSSLLASAALLTTSFGALAEQNLVDLDLETLMSMDIAVTSASRRAQAISDSAAAVFVITREDIRRSGATSLPEVLRLAPGLQVSRINTRAYAVTTRGFMNRFASKLLVMVDGRTIYTPLFSGVVWEEQSVFLDEIERVEVVRGPGGALWGINAVNGVINIITRKAEDSRGLHVRAGAGSIENRSGAVRYGGSFAEQGDYRVYVDHSELESLEPNGEPMSRTQAGWRWDAPLADGSFALHGDISKHDFGRLDPGLSDELAMSAQLGNVSASWTRALAPGELELRSYYSWAERGDPGEWDDSAFGFDAQLNLERIGRHVLTTGFGYRSIADHLQDPPSTLTLAHPKQHQHQWSIYGQDEVYFFEDSVRVIAGAKLEDLKYTGLAFQPTLRTLWHITDRHTLWAAASRAVRTPNRIELDATLDIPSEMGLLRSLSNAALDAEDLRAYEMGWRWRPLQTLSFDAALYRNEYEDLVGVMLLPPAFEPGPPPLLILPMMYANVGETRVEGAELLAEWAARDWLRLSAQATFQDHQMSDDPLNAGQIDPKEAYFLRAQIDLPNAVEIDLMWRSISRLAGFAVPAYDSLNARAAWRPLESIELSVSIENVFDDEHIESIDELSARPGVSLGRSLFARFTWHPKR